MREQEDHSEVKKHLTAMMYAESRQEALKERKKFEQAFRTTPRRQDVVENWSADDVR